MFQITTIAMTGSALLAAIASPATAASTQFVDDFNNVTYATTQYNNAGYNTGFSYSDGVGRALRYTYVREGGNPAGIRMQALNTRFVYDPTVDGVITSIDASIEQSWRLYGNGTPIALGTLSNRLRLLAKQGTNVFEAVYDAPGPIGSYGTYSTAARTGFVASDFLRFDPANPGAVRSQTGLDFSAGPITFGFEITPPGVIYANGNPFDGQSISINDVRAFAVTVNHDAIAAAVPEPAQWALLIVGFGAIGASARRRTTSMMEA